MTGMLNWANYSNLMDYITKWIFGRIWNITGGDFYPSTQTILPGRKTKIIALDINHSYDENRVIKHFENLSLTNDCENDVTIGTQFDNSASK